MGPDERYRCFDRRERYSEVVGGGPGEVCEPRADGERAEPGFPESLALDDAIEELSVEIRLPWLGPAGFLDAWRVN
jgi:hypothetical protein